MRLPGGFSKMAKTWHDRLWDMLTLALDKPPTEIEEFLRAIPEMDTPPESFVYRRCNEKGVYEPVCSNAALYQTAALCRDLRLMKERTCELTQLGKRATRQENFEKVVERQLWGVALADLGITPDRLATIVRTVLRRTPIELPTAATIWSELGQPGELMKFKRIMALLGRCGGVVVSQRPIYIPRTG